MSKVRREQLLLVLVLIIGVVIGVVFSAIYIGTSSENPEAEECIGNGGVYKLVMVR